MAFYVKKPIPVEASQWFKDGDHPHVHRRLPHGPSPYGPCTICSQGYLDHGWIDTLEGGHIVCPGDWIITGVRGEHYPCKPDIFAETYDPA